MKNMNEYSTVERIKTKVSTVLSKALIFQAEQGLKHSGFVIISESKLPVELLNEYTE